MGRSKTPVAGGSLRGPTVSSLATSLRSSLPDSLRSWVVGRTVDSQLAAGGRQASLGGRLT